MFSLKQISYCIVQEMRRTVAELGRVLYGQGGGDVEGRVEGQGRGRGRGPLMQELLKVSYVQCLLLFMESLLEQSKLSIRLGAWLEIGNGSRDGKKQYFLVFIDFNYLLYRLTWRRGLHVLGFSRRCLYTLLQAKPIFSKRSEKWKAIM